MILGTSLVQPLPNKEGLKSGEAALLPQAVCSLVLLVIPE
jgi:hypothetical protein